MFPNRLSLAFILLFVAISSSPCLFAASPVASSHVAGIVVDGDTPIAGARISIIQTGSPGADEASTDATGTFSVTTAKAGACLLRVHKAGYRDSELRFNLPLNSEPPLKISLVRADIRSKAADEMQFSDTPDFTVAGITDWTAAGGHGSDVNLRASEALANDTRALSSPKNTMAVHDSQRERELRAAVVKDPASFKANHDLGEFCLRQRQFADAIAPLEKAHQLNAAEFENSYALAQAYDGAGRYAQAKSLVIQLLAQNDRPELHRLLGDIEEQLNDPLVSEREYERAVQLQPSEENYFAWGGELLQHRAVEAAIDVFTKGVKAFPNSERMLAALGAALYAHGSYEDGAQRVCNASDLNPSDPQPYLFLGKMEQASPRPLPCVKEKLARFVHDQPNDAWASYYYAISLLKPDDGAQSKEAERLLENAVRLNPKFALAYLELGVLKSNGGDWQGAKEAYVKAAASDRSLPDPHFRLAQVYKRLGDERKASEELQIFESLKKSDAASVEQRRREIQQFVVVMKDAASPPAHTAQTP